MLSSDDIQDMFAGVLGEVYENATLVTVVTGTVRDPETGVFPTTPTNTPVKVQRDVCTQNQRVQPGYSPKDVRLMVLQSGLTIEPDTDSEVIYRSETFSVMDVDSDPFRVYWDLRARRK